MVLGGPGVVLAGFRVVLLDIPMVLGGPGMVLGGPRVVLAWFSVVLLDIPMVLGGPGVVLRWSRDGPGRLKKTIKMHPWRRQLETPPCLQTGGGVSWRREMCGFREALCDCLPTLLRAPLRVRW